MEEPNTLYGWFSKFQQETPAQVEKLCARLGIECIGQNLRDDISGYIERLNDHKYRIVYNSNHSEVRRRFTIAHELGHYYLHRAILGNGTGDSKAYRSDVPGHTNPKIRTKEEREANSFAADLLMPKNKIEQWKTEGDNFSSVRQKLNVSEAALRFRLQNLGICLENQ